MNALFQSTVGILAVMSFLAAPPRTLAEAARREALRRQATPKAKVALTNLGLPAGLPPASIVPASVTPESTPPSTDKAATAQKPAEKKDEQWWAKRISTARETLAKDQAMANGLQSRINDLKAEVVNRDSPMQRTKLQNELDAKLAELEATNKKIAADQQAISSIQDEARRDGVPPGWVR